MLPLVENINDKDLASTICNGDKDAISELLHYMEKDILFYAKKLAKRTTDYQPNTRMYRFTNFSILLTDEVHESYVWLTDFIRKKCCKYKGKASLRTFINHCFSSPFTKADWLSFYYKKFTHHGITHSGDPKYIPVFIKKLSDEHQKVFLLLRRYKNVTSVYEKSELDSDIFEEIVYDIRKCLKENGKIELISGIYTVETDDPIIQEELFTTDEAKHQTENIYEKFQVHYESLQSIEKNLLYLKYNKEYSVREILDFYQSNNKRMEELKDFGLITARHINDYLNTMEDRIIIACAGEKAQDRKEAIRMLLENLEK